MFLCTSSKGWGGGGGVRLGEGSKVRGRGVRLGGGGSKVGGEGSKVRGRGVRLGGGE